MNDHSSYTAEVGQCTDQKFLPEVWYPSPLGDLISCQQNNLQCLPTENYPQSTLTSKRNYSRKPIVPIVQQILLQYFKPKRNS